jgi:hypothetical protein
MPRIRGRRRKSRRVFSEGLAIKASAHRSAAAVKIEAWRAWSRFSGI